MPAPSGQALETFPSTPKRSTMQFRFLIFSFLLIFSGSLVHAQQMGQTIRGMIQDQDSEMPIVGATAMVRLDGKVLGGDISDAQGLFRIKDIPVGRVDLEVVMDGYDAYAQPGLMVTAGKEVVLTINLVERLGDTELETVEITDGTDHREPLNEMASLSARSFSVEETKRYAAAISDPGRMAQNFAGVTSSGDDMSNEIVIRGNSPRGMLWRLEGIEIPNPNHFGSLGSSGGPISMLSASTLANSDFYTGAFPAEFGNAYSGVFDLNLRTGNNEQRESSLMVGVLGLEASTEGYFSKNSRASYLINYRYSTLAAMRGFVPNLGDVLPTYQDLSFKVNIPTQNAGTFSLFGLGGMNNSNEEIVADSSQWESRWDGVSSATKQEVGVIGLRHKILLGEQTYVQTVVAATANNYWDNSIQLMPEDNYNSREVDRTNFDNYDFRLHSLVNHKFDARSTLRGGVILSHMQFDYAYDSRWFDPDWTRYLDQSGNTQMVQAYAQYRRRIQQRWTLNAGAHSTYLALNDRWAIDPRAALSYQAHPQHRVSVSVGMHSKPEHISTYFLEKTDLSGVRSQPNRNLDFTRAAHFVVGHDFSFARNWRLKTELYYQHLFNIPVENDSNSTFAIINTSSIWGIVDAEPLVSEGTGRNYGVDLTLEKFFSDQYYFLLTGSVYQSEYTPLSGEIFSTRFNGNFNATVLGGKEWKVGKAKRNLIGLNAKAVYSGGNRYSPIDFEASEMAGETVNVAGQSFSEQVPAYWRVDAGFSYTLNKKSTTHTIMVDIQNLSNRQNIFSQYYDSDLNSLEYVYQNGIFPILNYRVEF